MKAQARPEAACLPGGWQAASGDRPPWTADTLPQPLLDILDARAGRQHRRGGSVAAALAEILNCYDQHDSFRS